MSSFRIQYVLTIDKIERAKKKKKQIDKNSHNLEKMYSHNVFIP